MATVRSTFLAGNAFSGSTPTELYVTPSGRTAIVRSLWLYSLAAAARTVVLYWGGSGAINKMAAYALAAGETRVVDSWWVVNEDTPTYIAVTGGSGNVQVFAFGALLDGASS